MKRVIDKSYFNFRYIDSINIFDISKKILEYNSLDWEKYSFRQNTFDVHKSTKTIPLFFDEKFDEKSLFFDEYEKYKEFILQVENKINKKFSLNLKTIRAILVNLPSKCGIDPHIDQGESLESCMRFHIPIITNSLCIFSVSEEKINMKPGEIWEISNTAKIHHVINNGDSDRIHLIVDLKEA
jgi:hypothetical protein